MSLFTNLSIARKLMMSFAAMIVIMLATSFIVYQNLGLIQQSSGWTTHTYAVLEAVDSALAAMVDQETGVRGYLVSADERFLEPYRKGGDAYAAAFREVKQLTSDNAAQQNPARRVESVRHELAHGSRGERGRVDGEVRHA
jgi:methyl-accepting chemotaxis protein